MSRHAKLETETHPESTPPSPQRNSVFGVVWNGLMRFMGAAEGTPSIVHFAKKVVTISLAFFVLSSVAPLYNFTEGYGIGHDGVSYIDFTDQETQNLLEDIMTEDGFLLKPALNNGVGDRSTANEIFAYQVESGDTLSSLAQRFGIKKETLIMENDLWNVNSLRTGSTLNILPVDGVSHLVKKGDTVGSIAKKYEIPAEDIVRQNQLEDGDDLLVDSRLIIPGGKRAVSVPVQHQNSAPSSAGSYSGTVAGSGRLIWPTLGSAKLTQGFHAGHYALDIANRAKGPIFAAAGGRVVKAAYGWNGGYGNYVIIDHGGGMQTLYGHNEKLYVEEGQYVDQGQSIAWMGRSGRVYGATGIHVHFEVRINGVKYNPMNFF